MKIAYDITVLGQGYVNPKARTGIYRVVDSLLEHLLQQTDLELDLLSFHQYNNVWDQSSAELFIQEQEPRLQKLYHRCYSSQFNLYSVYQAAILQQKKLIGLSRKIPSLYKIALGIQVPFKLFGKIESSFKLNSDAEIYHSLFYPLPSENEIPAKARVLTIYDMIPALYPGNFTSKIQNNFARILQSINRERDWILCISGSTKQDFCNYTGMKPDRVFVTHLAAASHFYPVTDPETITNTLKKYNIPDTPYLLSLCTLEPRKNLGSLIRCFTKIILDNPNLDLNLVLVGVSGWKNNDIFQAARGNPILQSRIIFTGYVPDADLSAIYSGATAFVYPSLYEGFGLPPLEAMQCGTPVITSNTSSLPEVVGDAGILIDPRDEDALGQAVLDLLQDSQLRKTLSARGQERARQFSWSKCAEKTVKVYNAAFNSR